MYWIDSFIIRRNAISTLFFYDSTDEIFLIDKNFSIQLTDCKVRYDKSQCTLISAA